MGIYRQAAIVSTGGPCARFGREILQKGGSAVDAAIATLLCDGVCVMQNMGIGGGFIMNIYDKATQNVHSLIARETAPAAANQTMFVYSTNQSTLGALAIAVPGELKGYQEAHKRFGKLPWRELFQPTIKLCEEGVPVNKRMAECFALEASKLRADPTFMSTILQPNRGHLPKAGEHIKLPLLAKTLRVIADSPIKADELYDGSLTKQFVTDIQMGGGVITEEDMKNYTVRWEQPYSASLSGGLTLYSAALPGSGLLVTFMVRLLDGPVQSTHGDIQRSQLIIEAFKHAYGYRSELCDPHFANTSALDKVINKLTDQDTIMAVRKKIKLDWTSNDLNYYGGNFMTEDHGTDNVVVVSEDGSAVSVTSSINTLFGSKFVSRSTGILLNNEMDDFSTPGKVNFYGFSPSEANLIHPGKRPLSSMSPTIIVDRQGDVRLAISAAGGSRITTQIALVIIRNLWFGKGIGEAINEPRFHHQLLPMNIDYDIGTSNEMLNGWHNIGHRTLLVDHPCKMGVVSGIARVGDHLEAHCDFRRPGAIAGY